MSVVIPFHNRVSWTRDALDSVLGQTYADFEVIVVDDGSTEPADRLRIDDPRVRHLRRDQGGAAAARNAALGIARGKYVALLDSDDLFVPHKLETQVTLMEAHPDLPLTHTSYYRIDERGRRIGEIDSGRAFRGHVYPAILLRCPIASSTVMVRRDVLPPGACFEESLTIAYDEILWIQLSKRFAIGALPEPLSEVRIHGANATDDLQRQIEAKHNILRYAVKGEGDLRGSARRHVVSTTYAAIAEFHWLQRHRVLSVFFMAKAVAAAPLSVRFYRLLGRMWRARLLRRREAA